MQEEAASGSKTTTTTNPDTLHLHTATHRNMKMKGKWRQAVRKLQLTEWATPMVRPEKYEICFDAPGAVYFSNQTVSGHVLLQVSQPVNLKGVKMRFRGECCIHITDYPGRLQALRDGKHKKKKQSSPFSSSSFSSSSSSSSSNTTNNTRESRATSTSTSVSSTSTTSTLSSSAANGHAAEVGGVDNPGYIPDSVGTAGRGVTLVKSDSRDSKDSRLGTGEARPPSSSSNREDPAEAETEKTEDGRPQNTEGDCGRTHQTDTLDSGTFSTAHGGDRRGRACSEESKGSITSDRRPWIAGEHHHHHQQRLRMGTGGGKVGILPCHDGNFESGLGVGISASRAARPSTAERAWLEGTLMGPRQHYRAQETYFDCEFYIYGHKYQKDEKEMLPAGEHQFPFAFNLPPNLPPSFSSDKGFITYTAIAILDRPAAANLVQKAGFSLHTILDLNMDSQATSSCSSSKTKNVCGLCCSTGPITLAARIPRRGYVPGEKIFVSAEVDNISARNTRRTRLLLLQVISYIMPNGLKTHVEERVVREVVRGMTPPGDSDLWESVAITVPPLVPANVHLTCRLLRVSYRIDMILEPPLPSADLKVSLPLLIGSVPLRNRFSSFLPPEETRKPCGLPGINYASFPTYWFGECMFGMEALELQYERVAGANEDYGPQYNALSPFAPNYICYTTGNNVEDETSKR